ncbi:MAG: M1 family aminopeptidase [Nitrospira sp.]
MFFGTTVFHILCVLWACAFLNPEPARAASPSASATILHHDLEVTLVPDTHELIAQDRIDVAAVNLRTLDFTLAPTLTIDSVTTGESRQPVEFATKPSADGSSQRVVVTLPPFDGPHLTFEWTYRGFINDPPKEPRHLRFVTPSETAGHIGPEGVYLSSESQWYPDLDGSLSTFRLTAHVPLDWMVVTQGSQVEMGVVRSQRVETWAVPTRSEALTLVANVFATKSREWKGPAGQSVRLATYLFPEDAALADEYLDATAKYLDAYVPLLGSFPFEQFAVVENFFASGLGMPSFTLLGSGSIKRHYTQPYALGHEIVHSWIGNSVWNQPESGNWVEGLTTYLANYYWHELVHDERQAREQRRLMLQGYSLYVTPQADYPVGSFHRKSDEKDNAIGYQKAAMIFHQLRLEIGDAAFWKGVKRLVAEFTGRHADWADLERVFAQSSGNDLRWFFAQWIERPGAPVFGLEDAGATPVGQPDRAGSYRLRVRLDQTTGGFRLKVPFVIDMPGGPLSVTAPVGTEHREINLTVPDRPIRVAIDPDFMSLRRMAREQMVPVLNLYVTDPRKSLIPLFGDEAVPFQELVARIRAQETHTPPERRTQELPLDITALPPSGSVLILATAEHHVRAQSLIAESCGSLVTITPEGFRIAGTTYEGRNRVALFSCHRPGAAGSVVTVLYAVEPAAAARVARLMFFYGWHSAVVFTDGAVTARELWQTTETTKEVRVDEQR